MTVWPYEHRLNPRVSHLGGMLETLESHAVRILGIEEQKNQWYSMNIEYETSQIPRGGLDMKNK